MSYNPYDPYYLYPSPYSPYSPSTPSTSTTTLPPPTLSSPTAPTSPPSPLAGAGLLGALGGLALLRRPSQRLGFKAAGIPVPPRAATVYRIPTTGRFASIAKNPPPAVSPIQYLRQGGASNLFSQFKRPTLARSGAALLAGQVVTPLVERAGGDWLSDVAYGASLGAPFGAAGAGVGAAIGALDDTVLRPAANALRGLFGMEKTDQGIMDILGKPGTPSASSSPSSPSDSSLATVPAFTSQLETVISGLSLPDDAAATVRAMFSAGIAADPSPDGQRQAFLDASSYAIETKQMQEEAAAQEEMAKRAAQSNLAQTLALQQAARNYFAPLGEQMVESTRRAAAITGSLNLPAPFKPYADYMAAQNISRAEQTALAYQAQAALTPQYMQLQQFQEAQDNAYRNKLLQSEFENWLLQMQRNEMERQLRESGGGGDLQSFLSELGVQ